MREDHPRREETVILQEPDRGHPEPLDDPFDSRLGLSCMHHDPLPSIMCPYCGLEFGSSQRLFSVQPVDTMQAIGGGRLEGGEFDISYRHVPMDAELEEGLGSDLIGTLRHPIGRDPRRPTEETVRE